MLKAVAESLAKHSVAKGMGPSSDFRALNPSQNRCGSPLQEAGRKRRVVFCSMN
jgi:hypothetical protein